jgi:hypothetical protein
MRGSTAPLRFAGCDGLHMLPFASGKEVAEPSRLTS